MLSRLSSASLRGLDAEAVDVEVDLSKVLLCWTLVYHIKPSLFPMVRFEQIQTCGIKSPIGYVLKTTGTIAK